MRQKLGFNCYLRGFGGFRKHVAIPLHVSNALVASCLSKNSGNFYSLLTCGFSFILPENMRRILIRSGSSSFFYVLLFLFLFVV